MSQADELLIRVFSMKGDTGPRFVTPCVNTNEGTLAEWSHWKRVGMVTSATENGRGMMGHRYALALTQSGEKHVRGVCDKLNQ